MANYDLIIVGGGPAGLTAGIYACRSRLNTLLIEKGLPGGQTATIERIENYPGFEEISGLELSNRLESQAKRFGLEITLEEVTSLAVQEERRLVFAVGERYEAKAVIIASGAQPTKLGVPGEEEYRGRGVSYCATCDGAFFEGARVAVVGGGDSAIQEADYLTRFASKLIVIHRRDALRATKVLQERALANPKIEFRWNSVVEEIQGNDMVTKLILRNVKDGTRGELPVDGVFVYVGIRPNTEFLRGTVDLDPQGYIVTNARMETNVPGVYAAGDVRQKHLRQIVTAAADGAIAAMAADHYLATQRK
ncbi:MAG: thioredoxin-disulfide reductase [Chloroflexi bacterium]|nr:thioredoxin-disulfide reductase [Chloroflexota bacterium]MCL5075945.1 thioredoxin-disulfide reductase [Chloroflexota bacterium]